MSKQISYVCSKTIGETIMGDKFLYHSRGSHREFGEQTVGCGVLGLQHAIKRLHLLYNLKNSKLGEEIHDPQGYNK